MVRILDLISVLYLAYETNRVAHRLECDPKKTGSLGREAFVRGMWSIDGELAKAAKVPRRQR